MRTGLWLLLALGISGQAWAQSGVINADPNPCRIPPGQKECVVHITWQAQNATHAKVLVKSEGKEGEKVREFSSSLACSNHQCPAPWIRPDTRYVFRLYDFSTGRLGRELSSVTVTGVKER